MAKINDHHFKNILFVLNYTHGWARVFVSLFYTPNCYNFKIRNDLN